MDNNVYSKKFMKWISLQNNSEIIDLGQGDHYIKFEVVLDR